MKRTPMRRTAFRRSRPEGPTAAREQHPQALAPTVRPIARGTYAGSTTGQAVAKENPLQHAGYMAAVRALGYCMHCRCACRPQFCHRDEGKGMGLKTDCREGWPGCADCHWRVGTSREYAKEQRRELEVDMGRRTRAAVIAAGTWPKTLPMWQQ